MAPKNLGSCLIARVAHPRARSCHVAREEAVACSLLSWTEILTRAAAKLDRSFKLDSAGASLLAAPAAEQSSSFLPCLQPDPASQHLYPDVRTPAHLCYCRSTMARPHFVVSASLQPTAIARDIHLCLPANLSLLSFKYLVYACFA
jgi:hypothetical protein